jgi:hypothetical protein
MTFSSLKIMKRALPVLIFLMCSVITALDHSTPCSDISSLTSEQTSDGTSDSKTPVPDDEGEEGEIPWEKFDLYNRNSVVLNRPVSSETDTLNWKEAELRIPPHPVADKTTPPPQA